MNRGAAGGMRLVYITQSARLKRGGGEARGATRMHTNTSAAASRNPFGAARIRHGSASAAPGASFRRSVLRLRLMF